MNTERVFAASRFQFTKEYYLIVNFLYRYIIVLYAAVGTFHFIQLMIVCCKQSARLCLRIFVYMFHNSPCYWYTVVCRCTSSKLIEQHQTALWKIVQNICSLVHFNHKRRFSHRYIIACTHTGKYLIYNTYMRTFRRHKTTYLSHKSDKGSLS